MKNKDNNFNESLDISDFLNIFTEHTSDHILICDKNCKPVFFNKAYGAVIKEALGVDMKVGMIPHKLLPDPKEVERWDKWHDKALSGESFSIEYTVEFDTTNIKRYEFTFSPIMMNGKVVGFTEISRDITKRKKVELLLQQSEEHYRELVEKTNDLITSVDSQGNFLFTNKMSKKYLGYSPEKCKGMSAFQFVHPDDRKKTEEWCVECLDKKLSIATIENRQVNAKTNEVFWMDWTSNFHFDKQGNLSVINGIAHDITDRKQAEEALYKSELKSQAILQGSPVPMALNDEHQNITFLNHAFVETFGYSQEDIPTLEDWWSQAYPDLAYRKWLSKAWQDELERAKNTGTKFSSIEVIVRCKNGTHKTVLAAAAPLSGAFEGEHLVTLYDISERKKMEEALQQAKDNLERLVSERTSELERSSINLSESNIALKVLLEQREKDKEKLEENVLLNIEKLIKPTLKNLIQKTADTRQKTYLEVIETNLDNITAPFASRSRATFSKLTPGQIQIANLIQQGKTTKEIADILCLSSYTIATQRQKIRKSLALTNKKMSLHSVLVIKKIIR